MILRGSVSQPGQGFGAGADSVLGIEQGHQIPALALFMVEPLPGLGACQN
jgi:hypothetical protein